MRWYEICESYNPRKPLDTISPEAKKRKQKAEWQAAINQSQAYLDVMGEEEEPVNEIFGMSPKEKFAKAISTLASEAGLKAAMHKSGEVCFFTKRILQPKNVNVKIGTIRAMVRMGPKGEISHTEVAAYDGNERELYDNKTVRPPQPITLTGNVGSHLAGAMEDMEARFMQWYRAEKTF
jgi:hypothetical protein